MACEEEVRKLKRSVSARLLREPGVHGVGVEADEKGGYVLAIHVDDENREIVRNPPEDLRGQPVKFVRSGPFRKQ
jgi:hypothetical protein